MKLINKKFPRTALIALGSAVLCSLLFVCGVFNYPENKVYDTLIKQTAELSVPSDDIMLILLDQESIDWAQQELGWSWPWPRKAYADIVNFLADGGANSLAFDVMFTEPSVYGDADDEYFAKASAKFAGVIHTVFLSEEYGNTSTFPNDIKSAYFDLSNFSPKLLAKTCPPYPGIFPIKTLRSTAGGMGNIRSTSDADDIIRRTNLFYMVDGKAVPSLGMAQLLVRDGKNETLTFNPKTQTATLMGKTIPVDKNCKPLYQNPHFPLRKRYNNVKRQHFSMLPLKLFSKSPLRFFLSTFQPLRHSAAQSLKSVANYRVSRCRPTQHESPEPTLPASIPPAPAPARSFCRAASSPITPLHL